MKKTFQATLLFLACSAPAAWAYIHPSFYLIRTLANKNSKMETGAVFTSKVQFYYSSGAVAKTVNETMAIGPRGSVTTAISSESNQGLMRTSRSLWGGKDNEWKRPALYDVLSVKEAASIFDHFKDLKIPLKTEKEFYDSRPEPKNGEILTAADPEKFTTMAKFENRVAIVVGSPPDLEVGAKLSDQLNEWRGSAQIWFEKDSLLPIRVIVPSNVWIADQSLEYRMSGYQVYGSFLYPRVIQVYRNQVLWVKIETLEVKVGAFENAFAKFKTSALPDSELKDYLEPYFKFVR